MSFKAIVDVFPIYPYVKPNDTQGVANFDPRGIVSLNNLGRGPLDNDTHQISKI